MSAQPTGTARTIAVAMSGGVDSSTVAAMLRAEGHNVVGLTMQLWNQRRLAGHEGMPEQVQGRCCSIDDVYAAWPKTWTFRITWSTTKSALSVTWCVRSSTNTFPAARRFRAACATTI
jgi:asparagine synthetase B (glutamine-hydrolysing)